MGGKGSVLSKTLAGTLKHFKMTVWDENYTLVVPLSFEKILIRLKKKQRTLFDELEKKIVRIKSHPELGKPLRNSLRNYRRVQTGSHVLLYEINSLEVRLIDFDHHDVIYKKYR